MSIVPVYRSFLQNVFVYFLEEQLHNKEDKLEIITDGGKSHLYKHS